MTRDKEIHVYLSTDSKYDLHIFTSSPVPDVFLSMCVSQKLSKIKIAPNHTAGKSFSTDALDWIAVALSIAENIFLTSLSKKHNNKQSVGYPLPRCRHSEKILEANNHISLTEAIIHVHKLAAGKFL